MEFEDYRRAEGYRPLLIAGDSRRILEQFSSESIDCCMTSPPYWGQREYAGGGIGQESTWQDYVRDLCEVFAQVYRVLKPTGSFWLNIGDAYSNKSLLGLPWRVAFHLIDEQGWILRNEVIWNKVKGGMDNATDKLRNIHETVFHFVKKPKGYFYNVEAARHKPRTTKVINGSIVSATGVSGIRYRRQIEMTTALNAAEKRNATSGLETILGEMQEGRISDFRMIIRGVQRATHSDSEKVSGRARELNERGYYFLKYHPNGSKLSDVWDILPEDTQKRKGHFAPYPEDLCKLPILTTCPENGIVLDPFAGTGTTNFVAFCSGRKSVGIDTSEEYIKLARERLGMFQ